MIKTSEMQSTECILVEKPQSASLIAMRGGVEAGVRLGVNTDENPACWEDAGDQHIWRALERLFSRTPQAAEAAQTPHPVQQTQQHFSRGLQTWSDTELCKHQGRHRSVSKGRWEEGQKELWEAPSFRHAVRKSQFKDYCNNAFNSSSSLT